MHVIPRFKGDWGQNDDIYPEINQNDKHMKCDFEAREPKTLVEMASDAALLRGLFDHHEDLWSAHAQTPLVPPS